MNSLLTTFISEDNVYAALKAVIDLELGLNIVDLGLIYSVDIGEDGQVAIAMTLATPGCLLHASFAQEIERILQQSIPDLAGVSVELAWQPLWNPMMIYPEGRAMLGFE